MLKYMKIKLNLHIFYLSNRFNTDKPKKMYCSILKGKKKSVLLPSTLCRQTWYLVIHIASVIDGSERVKHWYQAQSIPDILTGQNILSGPSHGLEKVMMECLI